MKKGLICLSLSGLLLGAASRPASADDAAKDDIVIKAQAIAGVQAVGATDRSSKFTEYRDVPNGFVFDAFDLSLTKGNHYFVLNAERIQQKDARYRLSFGEYGTYKVNFMWDKIPHRFSFDGQSLYVESQPGVYTISNGIRSTLENMVGNGAANATALMPAARALLSDYLTGVHPVSLELERDKGTLGFSYTPSVPWSFDIQGSRETREGSRPFGATLGFSNAIELPEPIKDVTSNLNVKAEYSREWGTFHAGYDVSLYDNEIQSVTWDNPFRITDQTYSSAYVTGNGSAMGQSALAPSNNANRFSLSGTVKVLKHTRISGAFSYGILSQNASLLPYTVNTALTAGYAGALSPPRPTAMAKADITSFDLSLNSRIVKSLNLDAGIRYYDFANKTEALDMPGYALVDQTWTVGDTSIEPYGYTREKAYADLSWHFMQSTSLKVGYSLSKIKRVESGDPFYEGDLTTAGAPLNKSDENTFKVSLDSNPLDWLLLRVSYLNSHRTWSLEGQEDIYIAGFDFGRFYEDNRNRNAVDLFAGFSLVKNLNLDLTYSLGEDRYPMTSYGLTSSDVTTWGADLNYSLGKASTIYAFYENEIYKGNQAARESGSGTFSTDPTNDWTAFLKDAVNTVGGGFNTALIKNKLNLDISYSYSSVKGTSSLASPPGGTPDVAVNFTNDNLDSTKLQTLKVQFSWKFRPRLSFVFGYWYEQYDLNDIVRDALAVDYVLQASGIFLGALEPSYKYNVGFVKFIYSW